LKRGLLVGVAALDLAGSSSVVIKLS